MQPRQQARMTSRVRPRGNRHRFRARTPRSGCHACGSSAQKLAVGNPRVCCAPRSSRVGPETDEPQDPVAMPVDPPAVGAPPPMLRTRTSAARNVPRKALGAIGFLRSSCGGGRRGGAPTATLESRNYPAARQKARAVGIVAIAPARFHRRSLRASRSRQLLASGGRLACWTAVA